jgi:glyoxylase-like metal-dependent hydrolase (beta-lactamase superfamily II)
MSASVHLLHAGYASEAMDRVASTITLIRDADGIVVVDPGMVADTAMILDPIEGLGIDVGDVTDIVLSHHHPDHVINIALFPNARVHDTMAIYHRDTLVLRPAEGFQVTESVRLIQTPGHSPQDITTLVDSPDGLQVLTHLWWMQQGPADDPMAQDRSQLRDQRARVLDLQPSLIIPGHGAPFVPGAQVPL